MISAYGAYLLALAIVFSLILEALAHYPDSLRRVRARLLAFVRQAVAGLAADDGRYARRDV